ncbi:MAG: DNRLRE domain-containing protein [Paludibacter sp.]
MQIKSSFVILLSILLLPTVVMGQADCSTVGLTVEAKTSSSASYKPYSTRTVCQLPGFYENETAVKTNIYGSRTDKTATATGFYYSKQIDGRWWVVDPNGCLSICRAVNAISQGAGDTSKSTFTTKFGTTTNWMNSTKNLLNDNGFYCAGAWSATSSITSNPNQTSKPLAYTIILNWMSGFGSTRTYQQSGHMGYPNDAIFVFEAGFAAYCETKAQALVANKTDKNIFGYFTDNELPFYNKSLNNFLRLGKTSLTDENYLATKKWLSDNGYSEADTTNAEIQKQFLGYVAQTYFSTVYKAIKKYDPNHMILGPRVNVAEARENKYFMQAAGPYVDILAVNYYGVWTPDVAGNINWTKNLGKPFMVTEFYTKGDDVGLANTSGAGWIVKTQLERGYEYQNYTLALLESKCCVGWHWFKYMDNDPSIVGAEPSNIDANKGIVNIGYGPYQPLLDKMKELNLKVYNLIDYFDKPKTITSIYPEADAYYKGAENHGTDDRLGIKNSTDSNVREAFLRFNLDGLTKNIAAANLHLSVLRSGDVGITYKADFVSADSWTESSITQSSHPGGSYEIGRWTHGSDVLLDVKKSFAETIDTDKKLSIKLSAVNTVVSQLEYASRENTDATLRPRIDIVSAGAGTVSGLVDLFIDEKYLPAFHPDTLNYNINLPETNTVSPKISYSLPNMLMNVTLTNPINIFSSRVNDRTATIYITLVDGTLHRTYKLIFNISNIQSATQSTFYPKDLFFYPNPIGTNRLLTIETGNFLENRCEVNVTDLSGKRVLQKDFTGTKFILNLDGICKGVYIVSVNNSLKNKLFVL